MILTTLILITALIAIAIATVFVAAGGAAFLIVFGDVIVCAFIIFMIIKHLIKKNK